MDAVTFTYLFTPILDPFHIPGDIVDCFFHTLTVEGFPVFVGLLISILEAPPAQVLMHDLMLLRRASSRQRRWLQVTSICGVAYFKESSSGSLLTSVSSVIPW